MWLRLGACLAAWLVAMAAACTAAGEPDGQGSEAIGLRQQRVARMMQELEQRFLALSRSLESTEPERAARLIKAFEESKSLLIEPRMREIAQLLNSTNLEAAGNQQEQVIGDIEKLMAILLAENLDRDKKEEIARLKQWLQEISLLVDDEARQLSESRKFDKKDAALDQLAQQIEAVKELLRRQQELALHTAQTRAQGVSGLDRLADQQETLRRDTTFVAAGIAKAASAEAPSAESASPAAESPAAPGQKPLEEAARHQEQAERNLADGQGKSAQEQEETALNELKNALEELEKERDRLQKPPDDASEQMAQRQQATANRTESLSSSVSQGTPPGSPGASATGACAKCLGGACKNMQSAASSLKKKSPGAAASEQKQGIEELQKARKEIEKRLAELGQKSEDETVVRLEDIFREMLTRQQKATAETVQIDADRLAPGGEKELRRAARISIRRLQAEELELAALAQQARTLIEDDGTSVSFPVVVAAMQDQLNQVSAWLEEQAIGEPTQTLQREIEKTLEELIEALQIAKKTAASQKSGSSGNCKPCLLPSTAELKLLRSLQLRVNRRTAACEQARAQGPSETQMAEFGRVAKVQKEIARMVRKIVERTAAPPIPNLLKPDGGVNLDFPAGRPDIQDTPDPAAASQAKPRS